MYRGGEGVKSNCWDYEWRAQGYEGDNNDCGGDGMSVMGYTEYDQLRDGAVSHAEAQIVIGLEWKKGPCVEIPGSLGRLVHVECA